MIRFSKPCDEADYIVVRGTNSRFDGKWYDRSTFQTQPPDWPGAASVTLRPSGTFEVREDGAVAEVWIPVETLEAGQG